LEGVYSKWSIVVFKVKKITSWHSESGWKLLEQGDEAIASVHTGERSQEQIQVLGKKKEKRAMLQIQDSEKSLIAKICFFNC